MVGSVVVHVPHCRVVFFVQVDDGGSAVVVMVNLSDLMDDRMLKLLPEVSGPFRQGREHWLQLQR